MSDEARETPPSEPTRLKFESVEHMIGHQHSSNAKNHSKPFDLHEKVVSEDVRTANTTAATALGNISSDTIESKVDRLREAKKSAEEATHPEVKKIREKMASDLEKEIRKDAEAVYKSHGKAVDGYNKAVKAHEKEVAATLKRLTEAHKEDIKGIKADTSLDAAAQAKKIEAAHQAHTDVVEKYTEHTNQIKADLADKFDEASKTVGKVKEHSGVEIPSGLSKSVASGKAPEGLMEKVKANFTGEGVKTSTKVFRGAGTVVGLGAMIDGLKKIVAPKRNEQGEREGTMFGAVGEAGLGAALAYASAVGFAKGKALGK